MMHEPEQKKLQQPFPRRWLVYIAIKLALLAAAVLFTLRLYGLI